jgi:hypothetical protein
MKITVKYGEKWYGNDFDSNQFDVTIHDPQSPAKSLGVDFQFAKPVGGRGANWENRGWVKGATLRLSEEEARRIGSCNFVAPRRKPRQSYSFAVWA